MKKRGVWTTLLIFAALIPATEAKTQGPPSAAIKLIGTWKTPCKEATACTGSDSCQSSAYQSFLTFKDDGRFELRTAIFNQIRSESKTKLITCDYSDVRLFSLKEISRGSWSIRNGGRRRITEPATQGTGDLQSMNFKCKENNSEDARSSDLNLNLCAHSAVARFGNRLYFGNRREFFPKKGNATTNLSGPWVSYSTPLENTPLQSAGEPMEKKEIHQAFPQPPWVN